MTREAELRASAQMRDRIADILAREARHRENYGGRNNKATLLRSMERIVRRQYPVCARPLKGAQE